MKHILKNKFWAIVVICIVFALSSEDAFARDGHGGGNRGGRGGSNRGHGFEGRHSRYYYHNDGWHRHGWVGSDIAFSAIAIGALIDSLPPSCTTVVYEGVPYYYCNGYYYRPYADCGYMVVEPPVAIQPALAAPAPTTTAPVAQPQAQTQSPETLIIDFSNSKGEPMKVTLKKSGDGYIGPQGEYYPGRPDVEQLKVLYGKK